jgi:DNA polymerase-3 subunit chi
MTRIEFFFNVPDKLRKVIELSEGIIKRGQRLMVFTPDTDVSMRLEGLFWTYPPTGFLPHCRSDSHLAAVTPIIIDWRSEKLTHDEILINLKNEHPPFFSRFRKLIEVVGPDEADRAQARDRYRFYRDRGYEIRTIDVLEAEA